MYARTYITSPSQIMNKLADRPAPMMPHIRMPPEGAQQKRHYTYNYSLSARARMDTSNGNLGPPLSLSLSQTRKSHSLGRA